MKTWECEACGFAYSHDQAEMVERVAGEHVRSGCHPEACAKCGKQVPDRLALEHHLAEAQHWLDPDWRVHLARVKVADAQESLRRIPTLHAEAVAKLEAAEARLAAELEAIA